MDQHLPFPNYGFPVSIDVLELDHTPVFFQHQNIIIILVLSGDLCIHKYGRWIRYKEGDIALLDFDISFEMKAHQQRAVILYTKINTAPYKENIPSIESTFFSHVDPAYHHELTTRLLESALAFMESNNSTYSIIDDNIKTILRIITDDCQFFSDIINKGWRNHNTQLEYSCLMQDILVYINGNYTDKISLKDFSQKKHLNENYMSHLIKRICGVTFKELLALIRCRRSENLLLDKTKKISEIAYLIGFSAPAYYKTNFKKFYDITPEDYRDQHISVDLSQQFSQNNHSIYGHAYLHDFINRNNIVLTLTSERFFTADTVYIDRYIERFRKVLSDEGEIKNIDSEMNQDTYQAFSNMQKDFRMSIITIDTEVLLRKANSGNQLAIAKNINYLIDSGFKVKLVIHSLATQQIIAITRFMTFYSRRFIDTLEDIRFSIEVNAPKEELNRYKIALFDRLQSEVGPSFRIVIQDSNPHGISYIPALYDSFVLTPFAMDELFNPEHWDMLISFSLIDSVDPNGSIMMGGNGLLTWNGIKKPWWHAYNLSSKLRGSIINKGNDHIITNNNGHITILTYNTCGMNPSFLQTITTNEKLSDIIRNKRHPREHYFQLMNISGTYKITTYSVNESSCLFSKWAALGYPEYLTMEEESVFAQICHPIVTFNTAEINGKIDITTKEDSFGVTCVILDKIN